MKFLILLGVSLVLLFTTTAVPLLAAPFSSAAEATVGLPDAGGLVAWGTAALELLSLVAVGIVIRKSTADFAAKLVRNASAAVGDYKDGVAAAGADWLAQTTASEANYEQGVQESISKKRFGKGVQRAGAGKYTKNASELGAQRFPTGIANAKEAYQRGVEPAINVLKSLTLPAKGPKRSQQNRDRSAAVQIALGALKDAS